jgi:hypothetical protein
MISPQALIRGIASRILPQPYADSQATDVPLRLRRYGDVLDPVFTKHMLADEGAYFTATMTPGQTALAYAVTTAFAATTAFVAVQNTDLPVGQGLGKRIYLDILKFIFSVAPASAASAWAATVIDSVNRTPSANLLSVTPSNVNMDSANGSIAKVWFPTGGSLTVPAAGGGARTIEGNIAIRNTIPVVGDEVNLTFGPTDFAQTYLTAQAATVAKAVIPVSPVVIGPQQFALIYLWFPSNATTAASFSNVHLAWWER